MNFENLFNAFVGDFIGEGSTRKVYQFKHDKEIVVKVAIGYRGLKSNISEYSFYNTNQCNNDVLKWLAPCLNISDCGNYLFQYKTSPVTMKELPNKIPKFLTDLKVQNFGKFKGQIVSHDYDLVVMNPSLKLKKAEWWE